MHRPAYVLHALVFSCCVAVPSRAQDGETPRANRPRKSATAVRIAADAITLDGKLDEPTWAALTPLTDFSQKNPIEGSRPTDRLEVRLAYDDDALYVGARVISSNPAGIQAPVSRRDNLRAAELIGVSLDTYGDRRTAYTFVVTAGGVRAELYHGSDSFENVDSSWDPVWQASATRDGTGWTAEMRIPFSQLRFNTASEQAWGVNFRHWIPSRNEDVFWIVVPKRETGWSSWMGALRGISGMHARRRVEVLPYVASNATVNAGRDLQNPFDDGRNLERRTGADVKMGIGPSLTLQATVNPDFGQVEADPAEVNLSAFESFFSEKRPFFTEGSQVFSARGADYFYSRRIGARPRGGASGDFIRYPESSTILGAAKLTGQTAGRTTIGVLTAVTGEEHARQFDAGLGQFEDTLVAPLTMFGVARVRQQFGRNQSTVGGILTGIQRRLDSNSPLRGLLSDHAVTGGADFDLRFRENTYMLAGAVGFSHVVGDSTQILNLQRSSARYYQRPDAQAYRVDSSRRSLTGLVGELTFSKNTGRHWLYGASVRTETPGFETNDVGRLGAADVISNSGYLTFRENTPQRFYHSYQTRLQLFRELNYDFDALLQYAQIDASVTLRNFWSASLTTWRDFRGLNSRLSRGGPLMGTPFYDVAMLTVSNASSATTRWQGHVYYGKDEFGAATQRLNVFLSFRPTPQWDLSVSPSIARQQSARQYVITRSDGAAATYGTRYIFAFLDQGFVSSQLRANFAFNPDLTLELYGEPFASSGAFDRFGELPHPRARNLRLYGGDGTTFTKNSDGSVTVTDSVIPAAGTPAAFTIPFQDFNVRSWRSNAVLRWEYRPGSTLYVVWQQSRSASARDGALAPFGALLDPFRARVGAHAYGDPSVTHAMTNFVAIKMTYWIPM